MTTDNPIDLRRLRYFVAVARAAGFRQAAAVLGIAQPPLSQQVMALEKQLRQRLFIRHARTVELTDAGRALLIEAEPLLAHAAEIPERLRRAAIGETGTLRIGFTPALAHHSLLPYLLREFRAEAAGIELSFREEDTDLLCEALEAGRVDVAFIRPPAPLHARLRIETLVDEPLMLAVPKSHRLAQRSAVSLKEIADEDFVMFERALAPGLYDIILATCTEVGFSMRVVHHAPQKVSAMMLVAGGAGIAIVPSTLAGIHSEALYVLSIEGRTPTASIAVALRREEQGVLPKRFSKFCLDQCKSAAPATPA